MPHPSLRAPSNTTDSMAGVNANSTIGIAASGTSVTTTAAARINPAGTVLTPMAATGTTRTDPRVTERYASNSLILNVCSVSSARLAKRQRDISQRRQSNKQDKSDDPLDRAEVCDRPFIELLAMRRPPGTLPKPATRRCRVNDSDNDQDETRDKRGDEGEVGREKGPQS